MKPKFKIYLALFIATLTLILSCSGEKMETQKVTYNSLKDIPDATWEKLSKKKIYFGHQSVGFNIIDGVTDLMKEYPKIKLNIVETSDSKDFASGVLAHSRVGKNTDPKSKIDDFAKYIDQGIGSKADAAALKFCYVDMSSNTDIAKVFDEYKSEVEKLRQNYPDLTIIHFTEPLTQRQTGWKASIKKIIGREIGGVADNMKRTEYNERLVTAFQGKDPILDIAKIESTFPDGTRNSFEVDGKTYYSLVPEYTYDGGHLNEVGRKKVAEQLLLLLANLD
jgi:hypothetical protein